MQDHDPVNHPKHYTEHPSGIECIQITEHMNFCLGNAVKYIWRADLKADAIEDLKKAAWYLQREIQRRVGEDAAQSKWETACRQIIDPCVDEEGAIEEVRKYQANYLSVGLQRNKLASAIEHIIRYANEFLDKRTKSNADKLLNAVRKASDDLDEVKYWANC